MVALREPPMIARRAPGRGTAAADLHRPGRHPARRAVRLGRPRVPLSNGSASSAFR
ncbi:MAG: hypothetical protein U5R48_19600 [Gammaproteobacteria bacterium]|nr:hypothetical protein [Gammaproteobacteria bacterium]MDZ7827851.1 hypothetical protein [Gammaproteobacteria bacterium]